MIKSLKLLTVLIMALLSCCTGNHLISDNEYLSKTEYAFNRRKQLAHLRDSALFSVFNESLSVKQTEALKFMYAYIPLSDLADYTGDFFLANINTSLKSQSETPWGKTIPEDIFLHYVLPCRINNENLDSFRIKYYDELIDRVKGKDVKEAALEINHWCHEKVIYQASDIRTSSPLSTMLSARGRCGEESTFTVAALRTVGIPARQVYTPRWAHTDDNHAWVEVWINGTWYYMGACEPEPVLDFGWFTEPARRAMLVHTKSFGALSGNENFITRNPDYTDVNNLTKYAVTKKIFVKVTDSDNSPVRNAMVEYQLYNYAEFYPLAVVQTDTKGLSSFETGLGDLLIWAHKDDNFNFEKISVSETDTLLLKLNRKFNPGDIYDLDLDVPIIRTPLPPPSREAEEKNTERLNEENIVRLHYTDTWLKPADFRLLAARYSADSSEIIGIITRSMGNYKEITSFLSAIPDSLHSIAVSMLKILPDKDLRDTKMSILKDHLIYGMKGRKAIDNVDNKLFLNYVLNPRVANEMLAPWRQFLLRSLPVQLKKDAPGNPSVIISYLNNNLVMADSENYYQTPLTPVGVMELKVSDTDSRAICFVTICRSLGIPSRLEPGRNIPQYFLNNDWHDVYFSGQKMTDQAKGYLRLQSSDINPVPEYYTQFTLARFARGRYNTLEYDYNKKVTDFSEELKLPPGHYMLVTGNRLDNGRILTRISFFDLSANEHKVLEVEIRKDKSERQILGKADLEKIYSTYNLDNTSRACMKEKGVVLVWFEPDKEPTRHIFNDLPLLKNELDAWGGKFIFISDSLQNGNTSGRQDADGLPDNSSFFTDNKLIAFRQLIKLTDESALNLPEVIVSDKNGNIVYHSAGYKTGIGEQILRNLR